MNLKQLQILTEIKFQKSQQGLSALLARESELRSELNRLRNLARESHLLPPEQAPMRSIGADVIWLRWISQTSRELNLQLAQVLVQKEGLMSQHKRAFGKKAVADQLVSSFGKQNSKLRHEAALKLAIEQSLL